MSSLSLNRTNAKMPAIGLGLWKIPKSQCAEVVYDAIKIGYRLLDGACDYANEKEAGEGVRRAIKDGLVKREDLFITTKLWNTFHTHDHAKAAAKKQLADWGLDYFDLYLIHFPIALAYVDPSHRYPPEWHGDDKKVHLENAPMHETWRAMEELVDEGLTKNIGLSNVQGSLLLDVLRYARFQPQVIQTELHPYLTFESFVKLAQLHGIAVTAYSSFGPASYIELSMDRGAPSLLKHDVVANIAQAQSKTPAQILLAWALARNLAVIPKSTDHSRLVENFEAAKVRLTAEEVERISGLNLDLRLNNPVDIDPRLGIWA